jgi:hypothetical protein
LEFEFLFPCSLISSFLLGQATAVSHRCAVVPRRALIGGPQTVASLNSRLGSDKERRRRDQLLSVVNREKKEK